MFFSAYLAIFLVPWVHSYLAISYRAQTSRPQILYHYSREVNWATGCWHFFFRPTLMKRGFVAVRHSDRKKRCRTLRQLIVYLTQLVLRFRPRDTTFQFKAHGVPENGRGEGAARAARVWCEFYYFTIWILNRNTFVFIFTGRARSA